MANPGALWHDCWYGGRLFDRIGACACGLFGTTALRVDPQRENYLGMNDCHRDCKCDDIEKATSSVVCAPVYFVVQQGQNCFCLCCSYELQVGVSCCLRSNRFTTSQTCTRARATIFVLNNENLNFELGWKSLNKRRTGTPLGPKTHHAMLNRSTRVRGR
jgi:hypothetical protein